MVSNFVSAGSITTAVGIAILLVADVGSALVVQILVVRQTFLVPLLLLLGVGLFLRRHQRWVRFTGSFQRWSNLAVYNLGVSGFHATIGNDCHGPRG